MKPFDIRIMETSLRPPYCPLPRELFVLYDKHDGGLDVQLSLEFVDFLRQELSYYIGEKNDMMLRHRVQQRLNRIIKDWALTR